MINTDKEKTKREGYGAIWLGIVGIALTVILAILGSFLFLDEINSQKANVFIAKLKNQGHQISVSSQAYHSDTGNHAIDIDTLVLDKYLVKEPLPSDIDGDLSNWTIDLNNKVVFTTVSIKSDTFSDLREFCSIVNDFDPANICYESTGNISVDLNVKKTVDKKSKSAFFAINL